MIAVRKAGMSTTLKRSLRLALRLAHAESGTTAIEFGLLALPFIAMLVAIFETCTMFVAQEILQASTSHAARLIMTGQAQDSGMTAAQFQQAVCSQANVLLSCAGLYVNVQTFSSFSAVSDLDPLQNGTLNPALVKYNPGGPGDIVLVQTFYEWPLMVGPLNFNLSNSNGGTRLLVGTAAFRNEPYE